MIGGAKAKRNIEHRRARLEKLNLDPPVRDGARLAGRLIQTRLAYRSISLFIDIDAVRCARSLPIDDASRASASAARP